MSLFVNPTQFGAGEDLDAYPRDLERDRALAEAAGVDVLFTPRSTRSTRPASTRRVEVGGVTEALEGESRPGHFAGVATVVTKLFNIVQPDAAWFGQKDAQQALVIRKLVRDLNCPCGSRSRPTVREPDGLAMSSRNAYLTEDERIRAGALSRALRAAERGRRGRASATPPPCSPPRAPSSTPPASSPSTSNFAPPTTSLPRSGSTAPRFWPSPRASAVHD